MKQYNFEVKNVPVIAETEVLIVGSGTAGIAAAVASRRGGAKTMIVERYGCLGGALTVSGLDAPSKPVAMMVMRSSSCRSGSKVAPQMMLASGWLSCTIRLEAA